MNKKSLLEKAINQLDEDRKVIRETFNDIKQIVSTEPSQYAINGITLSKFAELLSKQTSQVIDLYKLEKDSEDTEEQFGDLDEEDKQLIDNTIGQMDFKKEE